MRKGSWLNRPVQINQVPVTNEHDVAVARARALQEVANGLSSCSEVDYYFIMLNIARSLADGGLGDET